MRRTQGLLRSPSGGTYPPWLTWDTSGPGLSLLPSTCQDGDGRIDVSIQDQPAMGADMHPAVQVLLDNATTTTTELTRLMGIDFDDGPASFCRFASTHRHEHAPSGNRVGSQRGTVDFCF